MKLLEAFYNNLKNNPDKIIYEDSIIALSNKDLEIISSKVYGYLLSQNIKTEDVVAIRVKRSAYIPAIILGVIKSGAAFTIIGEQSSEENAQFFIKDSQAKLIIDNKKFGDILKQEAIKGHKEPSLNDLACIIYSSGSSGYFKGSMHEYGQYDLYYDRIKILKKLDDYDLSSDRFAFVQGFYGAAGMVTFLEQIYVNCYNYIVDYSLLNNLDSFKKILVNKKITATYLSPKHIKRYNFLNGANLVYAYVTFEPFDNVYSDKIFLYNAYGLTESFKDILSFLIDKPYDITPTGKPHADVELFLIDENGDKIKNGEIGEIVFKSQYFRGYKNREDETKKSLVNGYFKTGDMAIFKDDNYTILGRKVDLLKTAKGYIVPIKIMVEIKKALGVDWCYVKCFKGEREPIICAYFNEEINIDINTLNFKLKDKLPQFMLPTHIKIIDKIDYFTSGKTNRYYFKNPTE